MSIVQNILDRAKNTISDIANSAVDSTIAEIPGSILYESYKAGNLYDNLMNIYWRELDSSNKKKSKLGRVLASARGALFEAVTLGAPAYLIANNELDATIAIGAAAIIRQFGYHRAINYQEDRALDEETLYERKEANQLSKNRINRMIRRTKGLDKNYYRPDWKQWLPVYGILENNLDKKKNKPYITEDNGLKSSAWYLYQTASTISVSGVFMFGLINFFEKVAERIYPYINSTL